MQIQRDMRSMFLTVPSLWDKTGYPGKHKCESRADESACSVQQFYIYIFSGSPICKAGKRKCDRKSTLSTQEPQ
jgi:hypothetical protein